MNPQDFDTLLSAAQKRETSWKPFYPPKSASVPKCSIRSLIQKQRQIEADIKSEIEKSDVYLHSLVLFKGNTNEAYKSVLSYYNNIPQKIDLVKFFRDTEYIRYTGKPYPETKTDPICAIRGLIQNNNQIRAEIKAAIEKSDLYLHSLTVFKDNNDKAYESALSYYMNDS